MMGVTQFSRHDAFFWGGRGKQGGGKEEGRRKREERDRS